MSDLIWRAARLSDAGMVAALFRASTQFAPVGLETSRDEVEVRFTRPRLDLDTDTVVAVDAAGVVVAYGEAADMGVGQGRLRIRLTNVVHPKLGAVAMRYVHEWLMRRAAELHRQRGDDLPGVLGSRCAGADRDRLALLTDSGFDIVDWTLDLVRPLARPVPAAPVPDGVVIQRYERRHDETARVAHNDAFAEDPSALLPTHNPGPTTRSGYPRSSRTPRTSPSPATRPVRRSPGSCSASTTTTPPARARPCCTASVPAGRGGGRAWPAP